MRGYAYIVAVLAAIGIVIGIVSYPKQTESPIRRPAETTTSANPMTKPGTLTIAIPTMQCEMACFPRVKSTLEGNDGVQSVELAAQQKRGLLDNRQVILKYNNGFNPTQALASLVEEGFPNAAFVE